MKILLAISCLLFTSILQAMLTFDAQNFSQSIKMYGEQLKTLQQLKQQTEYQIAQYKSIAQQLKLAQENMKGLNINTVKDLYNIQMEVRNNLKHITSITDTLSDLDRKYTHLFTEGNQLPDAEQNFLMRQHLQQSIDSNKRAINSLKILQSQNDDQRKTQDLVNRSQQATGQMQAMQSANQLAAMQIKELQDLKMLMAQDLEQRSAAIAEENTAKVVAHHRFKQSINKPIAQYRGIQLPNLKKK